VVPKLRLDFLTTARRKSQCGQRFDGNLSPAQQGLLRRVLEEQHQLGNRFLEKVRSTLAGKLLAEALSASGRLAGSHVTGANLAANHKPVDVVDAAKKARESAVAKPSTGAPPSTNQPPPAPACPKRSSISPAVLKNLSSPLFPSRQLSSQETASASVENILHAIVRRQ
jgi:hypothetical protein